jgi:hypothetical protein
MSNVSIKTKGYPMSQSAFLTLKAIISITFGAALIFVPAQLLLLFSTSLDQSGVLIARLFGVDMMGSDLCAGEAGKQEMK